MRREALEQLGAFNIEGLGSVMLGLSGFAHDGPPAPALRPAVSAAPPVPAPCSADSAVAPGPAVIKKSQNLSTRGRQIIQDDLSRKYVCGPVQMELKFSI
jgi:hypothetical protein